MKHLVICSQIVVLFLFYYIGVFIQELFSIPIPASIIGLLLLLVCLKFKVIPVEYINRGAGFLIGFLPLLFVPICIGVIKYPELFSSKGFIIMFVVFISTIFTLLISGGTSQILENSVNKRKDQNKWGNY
ncbi:CidA/LrgA family protein [Bacillus sp. D386]|uniref:CidA/LrgA family protein n=1 Tax=Bacillus sp. D386 TaxID=2587155 RepID=UPI00111F596C|nr:CidA/LrgA family holin-like protein [Bacillus sp. D386]